MHRDDIPVLTEVVDPDELEPAGADDDLDTYLSQAAAPEPIANGIGPVIDVEHLSTRLCDAIAEQIEGDLRLQLEARITQALESALPQIRQEVREILRAELDAQRDD